MQEETPQPVRVNVPCGAGYQIVYRPLSALPAEMRGIGLDAEKVLIITDDTVAPLYAERVGDALRVDGRLVKTFVVKSGEASKSMSVFNEVVSWALALGIDRRTPIIALGGGVVGDLAGFAAAALLRGLPFVQVPTTVIAQVDSATGGKTGVNHEVGKNLIGAFHQPALVLVDASTLKTLSERDFASGFAEVVKHALLSPGDLLERLNKHWDALMRRDETLLPAVLRDAVALKAEVVAADVHEHGHRAHLNLGHTFAHAIENAAGYGAFTHGEAVAVGLRAALWLSAALRGENPEIGAHLQGRWSQADTVVRRLAAPPLPPNLSTDALTLAMSSDKKRAASGLRFVVLDEPGAPRVAGDVPAELVRDAWEHARRAA